MSKDPGLVGGIEIVKTFGCSGAEQSLIGNARRLGLECRCFDDISKEETRLENEWISRYLMKTNEVEDEIRLLESDIDNLKKELDSRSSEIKDKINLRISNLEEEIDNLGKIKFSFLSIFSFLKAKIDLRNRKKLLKNLNLNFQGVHDRLLEKEYSNLQAATNRYAYLKDNKTNEIEKRIKSLHNKIESIAKIKNSPEYHGAIGELAAIKNLDDLPDDYFLLNDVFLELSEYIRFDNSYLKSAQIDHVVIGPTGVYVIETKNWSAEFVQQNFSEGNFTPYDQVRRGNYLVYKYLNGSTKIKSIIAIHGARIPPSEEYARVMRSNELSHHILKGNNAFSPEGVNEIAELLIPLVNSKNTEVTLQGKVTSKANDANFPNLKKPGYIQNVRFNEKYDSFDERVDRAGRHMRSSERQMRSVDWYMERAEKQMQRSDREWNRSSRKWKRNDRF